MSEKNVKTQVEKNVVNNVEAKVEPVNEAIVTLPAERLGLKVGAATISHISYVAKDPTTKQMLGEQRCELTNAKARYLFTLTKENGEAKKVKASVLTSAGLTQKDIDRLYLIGYTHENGNGGGSRMSKEEVKTQLDSFLA